MAKTPTNVTFNINTVWRGHPRICTKLQSTSIYYVVSVAPCMGIIGREPQWRQQLIFSF